MAKTTKPAATQQELVAPDKTEPKTEIITTEIPEEISTQMTQVLAECNYEVLAQLGDESIRTLKMARGMRIVREIVQKYWLADLKELMNTPIGFAVDNIGNNATKYNDRDLVDCAVQALMMGARMTGDEICFIRKRVFKQKNYYRRRLAELGVSNIMFNPGRPSKSKDEQYGIVPCTVTWKYMNQVHSAEYLGELSVMVPWSKQMGVDGIIGKAERRVLMRIMHALTGTDLDDENEDGSAIAAVSASFTERDENEQPLITEDRVDKALKDRELEPEQTSLEDYRAELEASVRGMMNENSLRDWADYYYKEANQLTNAEERKKLIDQVMINQKDKLASAAAK